MDRFFTKKRIIIVLAIIIIIVAVLIWWLWFSFDRSLNPNTIDRVVVETPTQVVSTSSEPVISYRPGDEIAVVARNVVERYGSYSNETAGQNIDDIRPMITTNLYNRLRANEVESVVEYQGVDTIVLSTKLLSQTETAATMEVSTQRLERGADLVQNIRYQKVIVGLRAVTDGWLVDSLQWQ